MKAEHSDKLTDQLTFPFLTSLPPDCKTTDKDTRRTSDARETFEDLDAACAKNPNNDALDEIPDLAAYMNVRSPPTPPNINDLAEAADDNFHSVTSLDPGNFLSADTFQQSGKSSTSSYLTDQPYAESARVPSLVSPSGQTLQQCGSIDGSLNQLSCLPRPGVMNRLMPRKRTGGAETTEESSGTTQRAEPKAKNKRRRKRNPANTSSQSDTTLEGWMNPSPGADSGFPLDGTQECALNEGVRSEFPCPEQPTSSPVAMKRRASGSVGSPIAAQKNERFVVKSPQQSSANNELNFIQNQNRVLVFSSKLANQAADSVKSGRHGSIMEFHRSMPTTTRLLSSLTPNQQPAICNGASDQQWYGANQQAKDPEELTPEQLKKRQENLAKLQGIGELLKVLPAGSNAAVQMDIAGRNQQQTGQPCVRPPCSMTAGGPPRLYRFAGPPLSPTVAARREMMLGSNGPMAGPGMPVHMTRCGGSYIDPYMDCSPMMQCPGGPRSVCPSSSAQLDWQRLQAEFYKERSKEQQQMGSTANMVRMPNGSALQQPGISGRRMVLMKANQPERFCSAMEFLRRTSCPQNMFSTGCEMQMCPSPKQMNYEIDGQELIITKQLNSSRVPAVRHGESNHLQTSSNMISSGGRVNSPPATTLSSSTSSELAQPLSSMLQMTNSIPQPSTSPSSSCQQSNQQAPPINTQRTDNQSCGFGTSPPAAASQKSMIYSQQSVVPSLTAESAAKSSTVAKTTLSAPCNNEFSRRAIPPYDMLNARNNLPMYKCQPASVRPCYVADGNGGYYFDEMGQQHMEPPLLVGGNASGGSAGCQPPPVAAIHNGHPHAQPSVNNTYVNATMSIQQLNIQSVQPGMQGGQHGAQQPMYGQQHSGHPAQFMNSQHHPIPAGYVSMNGGGGFDEMNQPVVGHHRPSMAGMMPAAHPQVMIMRGQQPHMTPRMLTRAVRFDPNYPPQHMMMPGRPEYARMAAHQQGMHHDMCAGYGPVMNHHPRLGGKKPMGMGGSVMMMSSSDYCRERMMLHHQTGPAGTYNQMMMAAAVNNTNGMENHMISMMNSTGQMDPSLMSYSSGNAAAMMMDANIDDAAQRKAMEMMDPVSARLAEAGMMFTSDPLEPISNNPSGKQNAAQLCSSSGDFMLDAAGQFMDPPRSQRSSGAGGSNNASVAAPSMYNSSCKDEVL